MFIKIPMFDPPSDGIKSETTRRRYAVGRSTPGPLAADWRPTPRTHVIAMGVNDFEGGDWKTLSYAAGDAELVANQVGQRLRPGAEQAPPPVLDEVILVSAVDAPPQARSATKENLREAILALARHRRGAASGEPSGPDDAVLISIASHGIRDGDEFYLLPTDMGGLGPAALDDPSQRKELLAHAISTADLRSWLRDVDAGEIVLIIDACHSAASVERPDFKPGPFGSRGLGQLAWEKGMRVLAASQ